MSLLPPAFCFPVKTLVVNQSLMTCNLPGPKRRCLVSILCTVGITKGFAFLFEGYLLSPIFP